MRLWWLRTWTKAGEREVVLVCGSDWREKESAAKSFAMVCGKRERVRERRRASAKTTWGWAQQCCWQHQTRPVKMVFLVFLKADEKCVRNGPILSFFWTEVCLNFVKWRQNWSLPAHWWNCSMVNWGRFWGWLDDFIVLFAQSPCSKLYLFTSTVDLLVQITSATVLRVALSSSPCFG